jgi:hypothetical protein
VAALSGSKNKEVEMKKLVLFCLSVGLCFCIDLSAYAQRGQSAGRIPSAGTAGQMRGESRGVSADHSPQTGNSSEQHGQKPDTTISGRIEGNEKLSSRLQGLLPDGMTFETASAGFKNLGLFIATLHVSENLDIPFEELQTRMTGDGHMSLGEAIHDWNNEMPEPEVNAEVKKAEGQAKADQKGGE